MLCVVFAFVCAIVAIPLGMPIAIVLAATGFSFGEALRDRSLWIGIIVQCAFAGWSYLSLHRALRTHTPPELQLKQRFGFILLRWVAMLVVCYFLAQFDFLVWLGNGKLVLVLLAATYVALSIAAEIAPDRVLREIPRDLLPADEPEPSARAAGGKREADPGDRGPRRP